ncbi:oligosaccharide flippase family protein [Arthrobacter sp. MDT3-44]
MAANMDMSLFKRKVGALLGGQLSRLAVQAAYFVVLARMLGPSDYGSFAALIAIATLAAPAGALGMNTIMVREVSRSPDSAKSHWSRALTFTAAGGSLLAVVISLVAVIVFPEGITFETMLLLSVAELVGFKLIELSGSVQQALGSNRQLVVAPTVVALARLVAAALCAFLVGDVGLDQWALVYLAATLPLGILVGVRTTRKIGYTKACCKTSRQEMRDGIFFAFSVSSQSAFNDLDKVLVAKMQPALAAGVYSSAYRVIDMGYAPIRAVAAAAYPLMFKAGGKGLRAGAAVTKKISPLVVGLGTLGSVAAFAFAPLVPTILGTEFANAVPIIQLLSPLILLRGVSFMAADLLSGSDMHRSRVAAQAALIAVNILLNLALIPFLGIQGAAIATLISEILFASTLWVLIGRKLRQA